MEGNVGTGIFDHNESGDIEEFTATLDLQLDYLYGLYIRGEYPVSKRVNVYGILGYTKARISGTLTFTDEYLFYYYEPIEKKETDSDFSYGGGIEFLFNSKFAFNLEYMHYVDNADVDVSAFVAGLKIYFSGF